MATKGCAMELVLSVLLNWVVPAAVAFSVLYYIMPRRGPARGQETREGIRQEVQSPPWHVHHCGGCHGWWSHRDWECYFVEEFDCADCLLQGLPTSMGALR